MNVPFRDHYTRFSQKSSKKFPNGFFSLKTPPLSEEVPEREHASLHPMNHPIPPIFRASPGMT
jgi:hypothetical protein